MKHILSFVLPAALLLFAACDEIDTDERFEGPVDFTPRKNVLIEDFTGQRCQNCPNAAKAVHTMQQTYGADHVIAVAIHGGSMSLPASSGVGFAFDESEYYNSYWQVDSWPKGLVDRGGGWSNPADALLEFTSWSAAVVKRLQVEPAVDIAMDGSSYDAKTGQLTIKVDLKANEALEGNLQVWLTESHIHAYQLMPSGSSNMAYEHNHVLRAVVNGTEGEAVQLAEDGEQTVSYTYDLSQQPRWVAGNMSVVAFVYNNKQGVMQVIDRSVVAE